MSTVIRKATAGDYTAVLDLDRDGKIYGGHDYIPACYHRFLQDPNRDLFVFEREGKVVAFTLNTYVDDGETVIGMAARTHSEERGKNLWSTMRNALTDQDAYNVRLKHRVGVTAYEWHSLRHGGHPAYNLPHVIDRRMIGVLEFNPSLIKPLQSSDAYLCQTRTITSSEAANLLRNYDVQWRLFPNKRLLSGPGHVLYKLMDSNLNSILDHNDLITASFDPNRECNSIGLGFGIKVSAGYRYAIDFFSQQTTDYDEILQHVKLHLPIAARLAQTRPFFFAVLTPASMNIEIITKTCEQLPGFIKINRHVPLVVCEYERNLTVGSRL